MIQPHTSSLPNDTATDQEATAIKEEAVNLDKPVSNRSVSDDKTPEDIAQVVQQGGIKHIAVIMDGNNRYAKARNMPKGQGHVAGKEALDPLVEYCRKIGIKVLTVFAFSSENWQRPASEVALLMRLLSATINEQLPRMHQYEISLRFIGDRTQLSPELQEQMALAEAETASYTAMSLVIAISYGGQWDIANATKEIAKQVQQGALSVEDINVAQLGRYVQLNDVPDVDMLIRTGGEYRISNFLLWQSAYAELFFTDTLWPEFQVEELKSMLIEFTRRQRRFGKTSEQIDNGTPNNNSI